MAAKPLAPCLGAAAELATRVLLHHIIMVLALRIVLGLGGRRLRRRRVRWRVRRIGRRARRNDSRRRRRRCLLFPYF